jgi:hypothetical protein
MYNNELYHYGVKGMKWGHRKKYYNSDGSLNQLGQARKNYKTAKREYNKSFNKAYRRSDSPIPYTLTKAGRKKTNEAWEDAANKAEASRNAKAEYKQAKKEYKKSHPMSDKQKTALKVGAAAVGTALAVYGAKKASDYLKSEAGRRSYEAGKKRIAEIDATMEQIRNVKSDGFVVPNYDYAARLMSERRAVPTLTNKRTKKVSSSTKEAVKYLYSQRKRK